MHQGNTEINGPHQGGFVELNESQGVFLHFQDRGAYGRILHLQPLVWENDWPFIGLEQNGDGIGEPVETWSNPLPKCKEKMQILTDDEFEEKKLGLQWQWQANPRSEWYSLTEKESCLRLYVKDNPARKKNLCGTHRMHLHKFRRRKALTQQSDWNYREKKMETRLCLECWDINIHIWHCKKQVKNILLY